MQFQPEATDWRPGIASVAGKQYQYEFPDDAHIRFFDGPKSHSMTYQFQVVGNKLVLKPQNGKVEQYTKLP
ncbi:hypothetical protein EON80_31890 [bacterium]|nr:MAG: hypothetical protein EON80_31890 [bacterium]